MIAPTTEATITALAGIDETPLSDDRNLFAGKALSLAYDQITLLAEVCRARNDAKNPIANKICASFAGPSPN